MRLLPRAVVVCLVASSALLLGLAPSTQASSPDAVGDPSDRDLPDAAHGRQAIYLLGDELDEAAALNGMSAERLRETMREDPSAWLDEDARMFYVETAAPERSESSIGEGVAPLPLSNTFVLHSRPASTHKIFIDFDGATVSGTAWNASKSLPAGDYAGYSLDLDPTTFSDLEKEEIQKIWQRVSEDYAPFDVDVTTQDPGQAAIERVNAADQSFGARALVSDDAVASTMLCTSTCGGVAYVGTYDLAGTGTGGHSYYQPAWIFGHLLSNNDTKDIAEAVSHEVGHTFGLSHDGTSAVGYYAGHAMWAPIMGNSYNRPVAQWSKGEYMGANQTQDDLSIIAGGGAPVVADEAGGTIGTASSTTSGTKVITSAGDQDVFALGGCAGAVSVAAGSPSPTNPSPNLDIQLELLNPTGTVVASNNPTSAIVNRNQATGLSAAVSTTVSSGSYFVRVDGVGNGTATAGYTDYASIGAYALTIDGCSSGDVAPTVATAPTGFQVTPDAMGTSTTATWSAPTSNGGSTLSGYTVSRTGAPAEEQTTLSKTWTGLTPGATYTFSVAARNGVGTSPAATATLTMPSQAATAPGTPASGTPTAATPPTAPAIGKAKSGRPGGKVSAKVTWTAPASTGGSPVTGYRLLTFKVNRSGRVVRMTAATLLPPGTTKTKPVLAKGRYRFAIVAVNGAGESPMSAQSNLVRAL